MLAATPTNTMATIKNGIDLTFFICSLAAQQTQDFWGLLAREGLAIPAFSHLQVLSLR